MEHRKLTSAILLMAGSGMRFGSALPKQYHFLSGKKVYLHTLERLLKSALFDQIILVCSSDYLEEVKEEVKIFARSVQVVLGGKTRQESSYLGLLACDPNTQFVLIHDAVRPFVSQEILQENIHALSQYQAVDTCIPCTDTIVHSLDGEQITNIPVRAQYLRGQTPQSFDYAMICKAHEMAIREGIDNVSDDCQLALRLGIDVHIVQGEEANHKITSELDLFLAQQYFRLAQKKWAVESDLSILQGKVIAITGGTGGIGSAIAEILLQHKAYPLIIGRTAELYNGDLSDAVQVETLFRRIEEQYGPIDGLINSIGFLMAKDFDSLTSSELEETIDVNLRALLYSCKYAKIKPGGHIINISSSSYVKGRKNIAVYSSTKAGVVNFTQALAEEKPALHVNVVVPKRTATAMRQVNFPEEDTKQLLSPKEVAKVVTELLCQSGITGNIIDVR